MFKRLATIRRNNEIIEAVLDDNTVFFVSNKKYTFLTVNNCPVSDKELAKLIDYVMDNLEEVKEISDHQYCGWKNCEEYWVDYFALPIKKFKGCLVFELQEDKLLVTPISKMGVWMLTIHDIVNPFEFEEVSEYILDNIQEVLSVSECSVFQGINCYEISRSVLLKEECELPADTIAFCFDEEAPTDLPEGQYTDGIRRWVKMEYPNGDVDYDIAYIIREEGFCC